MKGKKTTGTLPKEFPKLVKPRSKEEILWISRERFKHLFEQVRFGIGLIDKNGEIIYFNRKLIDLFNLLNLKIEEVKNLKLWHENIKKEPSQEKETLLHCIDNLVNHQAQEIKSDFLIITEKKGSKRYLNFLGIPLDGDNYLLVFEEITESIKKEEKIKFLEERFFYAGKLETIGLLTREILYNLKEFIEDILKNSELGLVHVIPSAPIFDIFSKIKKAGQQSSELISKILNFVEIQKLKPKEIDVTELIQNLSTIMKSLLRKNIELNLDLDRKLSSMYVDPEALSLILLKLIIFIQKMSPSERILKIVSKNVFLDEAFCAKNPFMISGDYIQISVIGGERGLEGNDYFNKAVNINKNESDESLRDIYTLIKKNNGYIVVTEDAENRIRIDLYFPIYKKHGIFKKEEPLILSLSDKKATILLAEDDRELRKIFKNYLEGLGYKILVASDGEEALQIFWGSATEINLAILDLKMPKMNGIEVYRNIQSSRPDLPYIFITGDSGESIRNLLNPNSKVFFLKKPFDFEELGSKICEIINFKQINLNPT